MFEKLSAPFADNEIEWRVMRCGEKNNKVWAQLAAYVDARAIMNRLDDVVGPANWQTKFREIQTPNGAGILCTLSLCIEDKWVAKEDGADFSRGIEITKSGISDSLKRVAVQWGIGRDLYTLPTVWAENVQDGYPPGGSNAIQITKKDPQIKAWCPRPAMSSFRKVEPNPPVEDRDALIKLVNDLVDEYGDVTDSISETSAMLDRAIEAKVIVSLNYADSTSQQLDEFTKVLRKKIAKVRKDL